MALGERMILMDEGPSDEMSVSGFGDGLASDSDTDTDDNNALCLQ